MNMPTCTFYEICILTTEVLHQFDIDSYNILPWNDQGFFMKPSTEQLRKISDRGKKTNIRAIHGPCKDERGKGVVVLRGGRSGDPNLVWNFLEPTKHMKPLYAEYKLHI